MSIAYTVETELKQRMRRAGLIVRDLAVALQESPSTTNNRLNGYAPLSGEQRRIILATIKDAEKRLGLALSESGQ